MVHALKPFSLDHLVAAGSWYEIGLAEGRYQRSSIKYTLYSYARLHADSVEFEALSEAERRIEGFLRESFPEELEEVWGIADGAEVDRTLLLVSNFPGALSSVASSSGALDRPGDGQCSNIMFPDSEWGPLLGGTLDDAPLRFILTAKPENAIPFCCVMWPGWVACTWGGMNAEGLAISGASAGALRDENKLEDKRVHGLDALNPQRVLLRSCRTVKEAVERLSKPDLLNADNFSLMDRTGRGVQVQGWKEGRGLRVVEMPKDRGLCCGNFYPWEVSAEEFDQFPDRQAVFSRYMGLKRAVDRCRGPYSVDAMKQVLTGHEGDPKKNETVCNDATVLAMIAAPTRGKLLFASRPPCIMGFQDYSLTEQ